MALARARRDRGIDYWPGFVDALSTLLLVIIFLLSVFVLVQFFLSQEVTGKDTALQRLNAQIAQLTELLSLEKIGKANLEDTLASLRANLATAEGERDRLQGRRRGRSAAARDAQARQRACRRSSTPRSSVTARALAQVELLNQQIAALRRQLAALEEALDASEKQGQGSAGAHRRSRPAAQRRAGAARAGAVALPLGLLRPPARDPRQPPGHPRGRRPLRVPVGGVLRRRRRRCSSRRAAPSSTSSRARCIELEKQIPQRHRLGAARRRPHRRAADRERAVSLELGAVGGARDRGGAVSDRARASRRSAWSPPASASSSRSTPGTTEEAYRRNRRIELKLTER